VWSAAIVEVELAGEREPAFLAGGVDCAVGPAADQGADEAFGFAVGARPVGPCAEMLDPQRFAGERVHDAAVAGAVVGQHRELVKSAIKRTHDELQAKAANAVKEKKATRAGKAPADPITVAKRERDAQLREFTDQAHDANSDLGHALVHNLATVDPTDIDVARFFVLCGRPHRTNYADCVAGYADDERPAPEPGSHTSGARAPRSRFWRVAGTPRRHGRDLLRRERGRQAGHADDDRDSSGPSATLTAPAYSRRAS
jgi:hypothetical protein